MSALTSMKKFSTAVTITDPLVKYQSLVVAGIYSPDPAQHRLARHLHKIYMRIKDYSPQTEYRQQLNQIARLTEPNKQPEEEPGEGILALRNHAIWRNPLFKHLLHTREGRESLALTRVFTNHQTAIEIDSPKGLFLSGEVGTGKSMLLDLLAEGLPTQKKKRWHFNTFMLYTVSQLENHRKSNLQSSSAVAAEYSLLWMAKKLVDESPILFLDEFQLPDRAASKILSNLFVTFFQLGGVLVASSNRMPEELQKATGIDYAPTSRGLMGKIFGGVTRSRGELFGQSSDFAAFLEVLKARCDFWQMEGGQDWRRRDDDSSPDASTSQTGDAYNMSHVNMSAETKDDESKSHKRPQHYYLFDEDDQAFDRKTREVVLGSISSPIPWEPSRIIVYGRPVTTTNHYRGFVFWTFDKLVESFGPADYLTMASTYHTFIIDRVPVLTLLAKNEARRFITLLDAMYEARCKLVIRAQSLPDGLFFPKSTAVSSNKSKDGNAANPDDADATYSETIAEVYQDSMSPFRPNVSYYDTKSATAKYDPDQDSDFGLEKRPVDFANAGAFTGEDERFAYKRAASRLWELCSARWHARTGDWWQPLAVEARHWEGGEASTPYQVKPMEENSADSAEGMGESVEVEEVAGLSKWRIMHLKKQSEET
ncbi:AFG1-like ATPase domain-containing protein [Trichoderma austrokoningii]